MTTAAHLRRAMVEQLIAAGRLRSREWISAFSEVPRHAFLGRFFRQTPDLAGWEAVSDSDPDALELIYTDATWVTQLDNDPGGWHRTHEAGKPARGAPTSSSTAPGLMALMLEALDVHDGHQVLEIGTGTGYHAALLCHRLSPNLVTTIEVDTAVAEAARSSLRACGYAPAIIVGDGTSGYADTASYDRLIATCSTPRVPPAWVAQVRPGGLILTSLFRDLGGGPLALLHVGDDSQAEGRFLPDYGGFMPVRPAPPADTSQRLETALADGVAEPRPTTLRPDLLDSADFGMIAALRLPGVASVEFTPSTGPQRWLLADDGSWACLDEETDTVAQRGDRQLWDEVEDTHQQWTQLGAPSRDRLGLTVTASGEHRFWLDSPCSVWWTEPGGMEDPVVPAR